MKMEKLRSGNQEFGFGRIKKEYMYGELAVGCTDMSIDMFISVFIHTHAHTHTFLKVLTSCAYSSCTLRAPAMLNTPCLNLCAFAHIFC